MRKKENLTWHECKDQKTMILVPQAIHEIFPHRGGISVCKEQEKKHRKGRKYNAKSIR